MATRVYDLQLERELLTLRDTRGGNRHDEVWDGVHVMAPIPNDEHQFFVSKLTFVLEEVVGMQELGQVRPGVNVSDREHDWRLNYCVPDVAVFLNGGAAENRDSYWLGGPDLAIEIISPGENLSEKLGFYHAVQTQELLIIDRYPWSIQEYVRGQSAMELVGRETLECVDSLLECKTVALNICLLPGQRRPHMRISLRDSQRTWSL